MELRRTNRVVFRLSKYPEISVRIEMVRLFSCCTTGHFLILRKVAIGNINFHLKFLRRMLVPFAYLWFAYLGACINKELREFC